MAEPKNGLVRVAFVLLTVSLAAVVVVWLLTLIVGLVSVSPWGLLGLIPVAGLVLLIVVVVRDRLANRDDDHYSKNVDE